MGIQRNFIAATRPLRYFIDNATYRFRADKARIGALRNKYVGQPMLVVGNGPSLNSTPLDRFADVPSIGMNKIDLIYEKTRWRPDLVVCLNTLVAQQHQEKFANSPVPVYVSWKARSLIRRENRSKVDYFNSLYGRAFSTNAINGFGSSATVTYIALQMAYWMGANPIVLLGVDHNFNYTGPKATYQKREGPDTNHFDPNYFGSGGYWGTPDLDQSERDYREARRALENDGRRVFDATIGGKLDVFEKIDISSAISLFSVPRTPKVC